jgi:hypothetical protein
LTLQQFPAPRVAGAYALSTNRQYHFAERFAIKLVEYCCYAVVKHVGAQVYPMRILDCATSEGRTPPNRHPPRSHDNGINLDLGYYGLADLKPNGRVPGPHRNNRMTGPPDPRLFAPNAEVHWFLAMARVELARPGKMVRLCATDPYIQRDLDPRIRATDEAATLKAEAERICFSSNSGGWEKFHHHHRHLRLEKLTDGDEMAEYIEEAFIKPLLVPAPTVQLADTYSGLDDFDEPCCSDEGGDPYVVDDE